MTTEASAGRTTTETAVFMVQKYGSKTTAMEYATGYQMMYDDKESFGYRYWEEVNQRIKDLK